MSGILVLIASFLVAIIGIIQSNKSKSKNRHFGLTTTGIVLVFCSTVGFVFGIYDQIAVGKKIDQMAQDIATAAQQIRASNPGAAETLTLVAEALQFRRSEISGSNFEQSLISASDFSEAKIDSSNFIHADLANGIFFGARFDRSDFSQAQMRNAIFNSTDFTESDFGLADFTDANFSGVDLSNIKFDEKTIFPFIE